MVRISDIFKKHPQERHSRAEHKPKEEPPKETIPPPPPQDADSMRIAKVFKETASDNARYDNLYLAGIQLIKEILTGTEQSKPADLDRTRAWIKNITESLFFNDKEFLRLFYEYGSENYMYTHMVNTAIMSAEIGLGLGYNKSQLNEVGLAGFLHDIGMAKVGNLQMQERRLTEAEYSRIKEHPFYGADILSGIKGVSEPVIYVARQEHERVNGTGYPRGLKDGEISEYARIVMIADVYEALTHNRPYRKKISAHDAIKELISSHPLFDSAILKVLINKLGIYPLSSWVQLNSNDIGKVIINNNEFPLRPVVHILFDSTGRRLREPQIVNLSKQFNLFIKRALGYEDLASEIKERLEGS